MTPDTPHRSSAAVNFFRKYEWLFALLGAGIVFTTFVVKDGLQSRFEREAAALSAAESMYDLRSETAATNARLHMIEREASIRAGETELPAKLSPELARCEDMREQLELLKVRAIVLKLLVRRLPGTRFPDGLEPDSGEFQDAATTISGAELNLSPHALGSLPASLLKDFPTGPAEAQANMATASGQISKLEQMLQAEEDRVKETIRNRESLAADRARAAQELNTLLFCLGWALGLVGKWPVRR